MNIHREKINQFREHKDEKTIQEYVHVDKKEFEYAYDSNFQQRKELIFELYKDYNKSDRPLIKRLIDEELKGFESDLPVWTTEILAFMLFKHMETEDIYSLFDAKFGAGSDHQFTIDIELIFGLGRSQMKDFLKQEQDNKTLNKTILSTIKDYEDNPDAKFRTRDEYIQYFETKRFQIIVEELDDFEY